MFGSRQRRRWAGRAPACGALVPVLVLVLVATLVIPAGAAPPIGPTPTPTGTVTFSATPVVSLANAQAITLTVHTSGGTRLVGHITAHLCIHGSTTYTLQNFGYTDSSATRCVYRTAIVAGGISGGDYEKVYPAYSGTETTSGPLTFKAGTGAVTWGNALGYGPFTLTANLTHTADLVVRVSLAGDTVPATYFIQPLTYAGPPGAPTGVKARPGNAAATVSWVAPADHGASAINGYVVTPFHGATALPPRTFNSTALTQTVTGLANASTYTFKVQARNANNGGALSSASNAVTVGAPGAPPGPSVASGSTTTATGSIRVSYSPPTANNGAAITKFTATCVSSNGGAARTGVHSGAAAATITVAGTTTAKTYTCTVTATNARGVSLPSAPSTALIVGAPSRMARPTVSRTAKGVLKVTFTKLTPAGTNGSPLTAPRYTAACASTDGGVLKSATGTTTPISVGGLTPGKTYTCTVKAHNARGFGLPSAPSAAHPA